MRPCIRYCYVAYVKINREETPLCAFLTIVLYVQVG
jgi:hypothetical protein